MRAKSGGGITLSKNVSPNIRTGSGSRLDQQQRASLVHQLHFARTK